MTPREELIEAATSAWRARDVNEGVLPHPAWADLDASGRIELFRETGRLRAMEAALDGAGLSTTARAVLARLLRGDGDLFGLIGRL